jgi:bifunctional N-acetylglucosamine-1-phosphate-uridyltransferase/glucosamine-1-phosphate-acetyltransferase GlmU-like protein
VVNGNTGIYGNVVLTLKTSVQTVTVQSSTVSTSSDTGALIVTGVGVGGNLYVDGNANVVGNADIGNVMLTTTSSLVQQVKIRATTASTDTTGRWWCLGGNNTRKCECWWKRNYFE